MADCLVNPQASATRNGDDAALVSARIHIFGDHTLQMLETLLVEPCGAHLAPGAVSCIT